MAYILREAIKGYHQYFEGADERTKDWFMMGSPTPSIVLVSVYLLIVLKVGPLLMENRRPFQLDKIIQIYNIIQVIACSYLSLKVLIVGYFFGNYNWVCDEVNFTTTDFGIQEVKMAHFYYALKVLDLMDTIFFVLRKKRNQITFLHTYHHAAMVVFTWYNMKFAPGGHYAFVGCINCFVHAVMYFYYFLMNYDKRYRSNVWWKKYITLMQMIQFLSFVIHNIIVLVQPNCNIPKGPLLFYTPQILFIFLMFLDFYIKAYIKKPHKN